jgi:hypothetical protein
VTYLPEPGGFLVYWSGPGAGGRDIKGRRVPSNWPETGTFSSGVYTLMATPPDDEMPDAEYIGASHAVILAASHNTFYPYPGTNRIRGIELDATGVPVGEVFEMSSQAGVVHSGRTMVNPRLAAGSGGQLGLRYNFSANSGPAYFEVFQTTAPAPPPFVPPPMRTGTVPGDFRRRRPRRSALSKPGNASTDALVARRQHVQQNAGHRAQHIG